MKLAIVLTLLKCFLLFVFSYSHCSRGTWAVTLRRAHCFFSGTSYLQKDFYWFQCARAGIWRSFLLPTYPVGLFSDQNENSAGD